MEVDLRMLIPHIYGKKMKSNCHFLILRNLKILCVRLSAGEHQNVKVCIRNKTCGN